MADLDTADRKELNKRQFAHVDREASGHLPINDKSHIRDQMARWNQTDFPSKTAKEQARRRIPAAARRRTIDVSDDEKGAKPGST